MRARVAATLRRMETRARHVCPACHRETRRDAPPPDAAASPSFPFCSPACKLADLGRWLDGAYRIPGPADEPASQAFAAGEGEE